MPKRKISQSDIVAAMGFGVSRPQFFDFLKEHEHLNAWIEYLENAPELTGPLVKSTGGYLTEQAGHLALKALQEGDPKYVVQQTKSAKVNWTLGDHELRYVVRVVQWCRRPGGHWSNEPLHKEQCEDVMQMLRLVRSETKPNRGLTSTLRRVIDEGLDQKREAEGQGGPLDPGSLSKSSLGSPDPSPHPANQAKRVKGHNMQRDAPGPRPVQESLISPDSSLHPAYNPANHPNRAEAPNKQPEAVNIKQQDEPSPQPIQENNNHVVAPALATGSSAASNQSQFVLSGDVFRKLYQFQKDLSLELGEIRMIDADSIGDGLQFVLSEEKYPLLRKLQRGIPTPEDIFGD